MTSRFVSPFYDVGSGIKPSSGSRLFFFKTDGVTPKDTFSDQLSTPTPNTNPVISDSNGVFGDIYISGDYKVTLKDKNDSLKFSLVEVSEVATNVDANVTVIKVFDTVQEFKDYSIEFPDGKIIRLLDRGADFTKITGTGAATSYKIIASTSVNQSIDLIVDKGVVSSEWGMTPALADIKAVWQQMLDYALSTGLSVEVMPGTYTQLSSASINVSGATNNAGVNIFSKSSNNRAIINYTGTGYALLIQGTGSEGGAPLIRWGIENIQWNGQGNTDSDGLLFLERVYMVDFKGVSLENIGKSTADCLTIRNCFNVNWNGGNISGTFPLGTNRSGVRIGSTTATPWATSNVAFRNTLIQYNGKNALFTIHEGNIMDNLIIENSSLGKNSEWHVHVDSPDISNVTLSNVHFEDSGWNGTTTPDTGFGNLLAVNIKCLSVENCLSVDAHTHFFLDGVQGFNFTGNKVFESGVVTIAGSTMIKLRSTTSRCTGAFRISENFIRDDQIDDLYNIVETEQITLTRDFVIKAQSNAEWAATY